MAKARRRPRTTLVQGDVDFSLDPVGLEVITMNDALNLVDHDRNNWRLPLIFQTLALLERTRATACLLCGEVPPVDGVSAIGILPNGPGGDPELMLSGILCATCCAAAGWNRGVILARLHHKQFGVH